MIDQRLSPEDHDILIDLRQMFISFIGQSKENDRKMDAKIDDLKESMDRNFEAMNNKICSTDSRVTICEKDIIRLQGADSSLQSGMAAQGIAISAQANVFQTIMEKMNIRVDDLDKEVGKEIPKERVQELKDQKAQRWNEIWVYVTIAGIIIGSIISFVVGWYGHP